MPSPRKPVLKAIAKLKQPFPSTPYTATNEDKLQKKRKRGRCRTCCFWFTFILFAFTGPIFLNAIKLLDDIPVFNRTSFGITIQNFGELDSLTTNCSLCQNEQDITFPVFLKFNLQAKPSGQGIVLFASNDGKKWYTGAVSGPLQLVLNRDQRLRIDGGCFGNPGPLWMVACLTRTSSIRNYKQGSPTWNPPFDDRCAVLGTRCGVSCGAYYQDPEDQSCENQTIPISDLVSKESGGELDTVRIRNRLPSVLLSVFIAFSLLSILLEMIEAAPALFKTGWHPTIPLITDLCKINFGFQGPKRIVVASFTPCAGEGETVVLRSMISVLTSLLDFKVRHDFGNVFDVHHFLADDTSDHKYYELFSFLKAKKNHLDPLHFNGLAMQARDKIIEICEDPDKWAAQEKTFFPLGDPYHGLWTEWLEHKCDPVPRIHTNSDGTTESFIDETIKLSFDKPSKLGTVSIHCHYIWWEKKEGSKKAGKANKLKLVGDAVKKQIRPNIGPKNKFLAILDARHAPTTEFWEVSLPHFWKEKRTVITRNEHVRASQENQFFPRVFRRQDDYLDREHGHYYNLLMPMRDMGGVTTSAGTNSIWHLGDYKTKEKFTFPTETMSEDTELSHIVILKGETIRFVGMNTVKGCAKSEKNYIDAVARWSAGGVELMVLAFASLHPVLFVYAGFIFVYAGQAALVLVWTDNQIAVWGLQAIIVMAFCALARNKRRFQALLVIFSNTIFWFTGAISAIWWVIILPLCLSFGLSFRVNVLVLLIGTLLSLICQTVISRLAKWWGGAREIHFWRAYQMWALLWPLNLIAPYWAWRGKKAWSSVYRVYFQLTCTVLQLIGHVVGIIYPVVAAWIQYSTGPLNLIDIMSDSRLMGALVSFWMLVSVWDPALTLILRKPLQVSSRQVLMSGMVALLFVYLFVSEKSTLPQQLSVFIPTFLTPVWFREAV